MAKVKIKANKLIIIDAIIVQLRKGKGYSEIFGQICTKWDISRSTFSNYWKIATQKHTEHQDVIKAAKQELDIQSALSERKSQIADVLERKEILTQISRGQIPLRKAVVVDGSLEYYEVVPDWMDRKGAIAELNKMEGEYAPNKLEITGKDGVQLFKFGYGDDTEGDN